MLTSKEKDCIKAIFINAQAACGAQTPFELYDDNYSWFDRKDITRLTNFGRHEAAGLMSSLHEKGLIVDHEGDGTGWALSDEGINVLTNII